MFDLLGGALQQTAWRTRLHRLPVSFAMSSRRVGNQWRPGRITYPQRQQLRRILDDHGLSPHALARSDRPTTFVDVVHGGSTLTKLYEMLQASIEHEREPWKSQPTEAGS